MSKSNPNITLETRGRVAIITINQPKKLNAIRQEDTYQISQYLREIDADENIFITVLTAKGRFFSAGADVKVDRSNFEGEDVYAKYLQGLVAQNLNTTQAFYSHSKILVTALNGPVVGIMAAFIAMSDFIYAAPHTYLLTPFSSLGLVSEGLASKTFVQRMGLAKAKEALIMSKRITCDELVQTGFVNKVFDTKPDESDRFLKLVLAEVDDRLGDHLVADSMTKIKALIHGRQEREAFDAHGVTEVYAGLDRFMDNIPQREFMRMASGEKRHKL